MPWTTPITWTTNQVVTAAQLNVNIRDNLLETAPAKATTSGSFFVGAGVNSIAERIPQASPVLGSETTLSTTYTDLTTVGPSVTVTSGTKAFVILSGAIANNTVGAESLMSFDVSGAAAASTTDTNSLTNTSSTANARHIGAACILQTGLTAGISTYTARYRVSAGTGTFNVRRLSVIPF